MSLAPLSTAQQSAIDALVASGRLQKTSPDPARARSFLTQAGERISQLPLITIDHVRYTVAYDAAHDVGEALLAAYGYRTGNGPGQHDALGRFIGIVIDAPPSAVREAAAWDRHRRARNDQHYSAKPVGSAQVVAVARFAHELHTAATHRGIT